MKSITKHFSLSAGFTMAALISTPMGSFAAELKFDQGAVSSFCAQVGGDVNSCVSQNSAAYKVVRNKLAAEKDAEQRLVMGGCIQNSMPNWIMVADCVTNPPPALNTTIPVEQAAAPSTSSAPAQAFNSGTLAGQLMAATSGVPSATAQKLVQTCITQWQGEPSQSKYCVKKEVDGWKALNIN